MDRVLITGMSRRSDKRIEDPQIEAEIKHDGKCICADILNISRIGLRFRADEKFRKGEKLLFELRGCNLNANQTLQIKGKIKNEYNSGGKETNEYGIRFCRAMQWYEMNMIHEFVYACGKH